MGDVLELCRLGFKGPRVRGCRRRGIANGHFKEVLLHRGVGRHSSRQIRWRCGTVPRRGGGGLELGPIGQRGGGEGPELLPQQLDVFKNDLVAARFFV